MLINLELVNSLVINTFILMMYVIYLFNEKHVIDRYINLDVINKPLSFFKKLKIALSGGGAGILVILNAFEVEGYFIDLRLSIVLITYLIAGLSTSLIAMLIMSSFRLLYEPSNMELIFQLLVMINLMTLLMLYFLSKFKKSSAYMLLNCICIFLIQAGFYYALLETSTFMKVTVFYGICLIISSISVFKLSSLLVTNRRNTIALTKISTHDHLTGIKNRRGIEDVISGSNYTVLLIDVDNFKKVNDSYGHDVGDVVLKELANVLKTTEETFETVVGRYGGEEFIVISKTINQSIAVFLSEHLIERVRKHKIYIDHNKFLKITVSIGVAIGSSNQTFKQILHEADQSLYFIKENGKDNYRIS